MYMIDRINKNQFGQHNTTLGYRIYDSCGDPRKAIKSILQILSGSREPVPNYSCVGKGTLAGFIGDLVSETTVPIAQILSVFGYTQISYGATDPVLSDRFNFPYFFRTTGSDDSYYLVISKIAKYFQWNWVGIITFEDDRGERDLQLLKYYLSSENICVDFTLKLTTVLLGNRMVMETLQKSSTNIIIFCGAVNIEAVIQFKYLKEMVSEKTFIFTTNWLYYNHIFTFSQEFFYGSLLLMQNKADNANNDPYVLFSNQFNPSRFPDDKLLENIWMYYHSCLSKNQQKNKYLEKIFKTSLHNCSGQESILNIILFNNRFHTLNMMFAIDLLTSTLYHMHYTFGMETSGMNRKMYNYRYKVHHYLKRIDINYSRIKILFSKERGEFVSQYVIMNLYGRSDQKSAWKQCGTYIPWAPAHQQLYITPDEIQWKTKGNKVPRAQCSDSCPTGFRKTPKPRAKSCCYDCAPCSEGEISNTTENEICNKCPDMEWPNEKSNTCIGKNEDFLSYTNDMFSVFFISVSVFLYLIALLILGLFIVYWNMVKENNRSLSLVLLVSIKLSFLSVFMFLGRPVDITCMLRIITFGITFSIAVSSLLAKTIMVCVAFKATKPGSSWRKWVGVKLSNSVVLFGSSIQIIICMTWLVISPPFQELDLHTYPGTIIIQCNEGSAIGFYSVIGYMGLLAAVSFVLAFLAQTLPDSFNEAKYITFSMLLFCSVWITMIPAYLSTKGKNTVCVEIFAILTSSAGLLASIFLPKCSDN
ncbi:hypothetical protein XELAEV_18000422mg [Xenopus laevis]|uniref:G-protein coupled receptors family 3 profile domain-containing protein n=1 Tax=Xenopus laevis TaxID=8355 RepID=A0A974BQG9_XENLA|nr:hypothetical protein XELAEV_18000422mg [Xenopus laevis]